MEMDILRLKRLTFKNTFIFVKNILFANFLNFSKLFCLWVLFALLLSYAIQAFSDYFVAFSFILAYIVFYLFYLSFIVQSRAVIDKNKLGIFTTIKEVSSGFISRKGLDLLVLIPAVVVIFLIVFFPSSIFAVPLAFVITLTALICFSYIVLTQPVLVIKKMAIEPAIKYSMNLISGYFTFVLGLMLTLLIACTVLYLPFIFIKTSSFLHHFFIISMSGIEILLFAIMLTVVYTNLEIAWSVGFKNYVEGDFVPLNLPENNHEFTEFFNSVPEVKIQEDTTDTESKDLEDK